MMLKIYVPVPGDRVATRGLKAGSAIVGDPSRLHDGLVLVHYEGNVYGASNLGSFNGRLTSAAGRLRDRYPTVAMMLASFDDLIEVGEMDARRMVVTEISRPGELEAWSGEDASAILGTTVPEGPMYGGMPEGLHEQLEFVVSDGAGFVFRSRAGQVVVQDGQGLRVMAHDDPSVADLLQGRVDDRRLAWVVGEPSASSSPRL